MVQKATDSALGGRIGARLTALLSQGKVATTAGLAGHYVTLARLIQEDFFALTGSELRRTMGPLLSKLAATPNIDPDVANTLRFVGAGKGQFATMLGNQVVGQAVGTGLGGLLTNLLQPAIGRSIAGNPHLPLSTSDAAQAMARNLSGAVDTRFDMLQQGLDDNRIDVMVALSKARLTPDVYQELVRRGGMPEDFAMVQLERLGYDAADAARILELRRVLHSPAVLADMVNFGILGQDQAAGRAAQQGVDGRDFDELVQAAGDSLSVTDLMEAYRRHIIDDARLEHGIRQGRTKTEWIPTLKALRYSPMSLADAIQATVQGHISEAESRTIADQNGLLPAHWQALYDTAGESPGVQQMVSMYRRGIITQAQLVQGIKESRLKNKWIQATIDESEVLPTEAVIRHLVATNIITPARGMDLLLKRGYAKDIAQAFIDESHHTKTTAARELSTSQIVTLYEDRAIDRATALSMLEGVNWDKEVAPQLLDLADMRRTKTYVNSAISRIRAAYLASRVDESTAATDMDLLRVAPDQRDELLALWGLEKAIPTKQLTEAQLRAAASSGLITWADYEAKLVAIGYSPEDASLLAILHGPKQLKA